MKIFITGGSRGIGNGIVMAAVKAGHDVAFTYHNPETNVEAIVEEAKAVAPDRVCRGYQLDISKSDLVEEVVNEVIDDFDEIGAVVNNAGINRDNLVFNMSDEEWHEVIDTNLSGSFYVMRQFLPHFLGLKRGRFISISSIAKDGISGQANYGASKAGLVGLSGSIAKEYGQKGITSNVVVPGLFETDMTSKTLSKALRDFWLDLCPLKRMGRLEEISDLVLFLASDKSSFINGQVISITGGLDWAG